MKKYVILIGLLTLGGCQEYQASHRELPLTDNVVPLPILCKKAKLSDNLKVIALANRYCATQNADRLISARKMYEEIRQCYSSGKCSD